MPDASLPLAQRYDFYFAVHRGLRLGHGQMLTRIGATDFTDDGRARSLTSALRAHVALCRDHLEQEDRFIHVALEQRAPGASAKAAAGHEHHGHAFAALTGLADEIDSSSRVGRSALGHSLYLRFADFMADDFAHMAEEERVLMPRLQLYFSDAELHEMEGRIIAATAPAMMDIVLGLMMPAISAPERAEMLLSMRRGGMPIEAYADLLRRVVLPALDSAERNDLLLRLDPTP